MHKRLMVVNFAKLVSYLALCSLAMLFLSHSAFAADGIVETTFFGNFKDDGSGCGIYLILNSVIDTLSIGVGIMAVIGITLVGIQYLTARGNEEQARKARHRMLEIVIGLAFYVSLSAGLQFLLPGGRLNNNQGCTTVSDQELADRKTKKIESSDSNGSLVSKKTEYTKTLDAKPFSLNVKGTGKIKYKSSNKRVAYVTSKGVVYPNDVGTATITASSGSQKTKIKIKIKTRKKKPKFVEVPAGDVVIKNYEVGGRHRTYNYVFRYKNPVRAEKAADLAIITAHNNHIVGHEGDNFSFTKEMKRVGWNPKKIKRRVATACSQFVLTMAQATGIKRKPLKWSNEDAPGAAKVLKESSYFYTLKSKKYTRNWKRLRRGDIVIDADRSDGGAHAVMVGT